MHPFLLRRLNHIPPHNCQVFPRNPSQHLVPGGHGLFGGLCSFNKGAGKVYAEMKVKSERSLSERRDSTYDLIGIDLVCLTNHNQHNAFREMFSNKC